MPEISQSEGARLSAQPGQILAGYERGLAVRTGYIHSVPPLLMLCFTHKSARRRAFSWEKFNGCLENKF